jgi:hypothetical protein
MAKSLAGENTSVSFFANEAINKKEIEKNIKDIQDIN